MHQATDHTLWGQLKAGDEAAFRELFDLYWEELLSYAYHITRDMPQAQDTVQGLFIHLWEKHDGLPSVVSVAGYLKTALKNRLLNAIRDEQLYQDHVELFVQVLGEGDHSLLEQLQAKDTEQELLRTIDMLPGKMKDVFYLHRIESLTVAEIAQRTGASEQTIRNQLNTALHRIKAQWGYGVVVVVVWWLYQ